MCGDRTLCHERPVIEASLVAAAEGGGAKRSGAHGRQAREGAHLAGAAEGSDACDVIDGAVRKGRRRGDDERGARAQVRPHRGCRQAVRLRVRRDDNQPARVHVLHLVRHSLVSAGCDKRELSTRQSGTYLAPE